MQPRVEEPPARRAVPVRPSLAAVKASGASRCPSEQATRLVLDAMFPLAKVDVVQPRAPLNAVLERMERDGKRFALVLEQGKRSGF